MQMQNKASRNPSVTTGAKGRDAAARRPYQLGLTGYCFRTSAATLPAFKGHHLRKAGEGWEQLRERHGDSSGDMLLYLEERRCGMKLRELTAESGLESYGAAAMAIKPYDHKLAHDAS
jgi:hypothetical protein